MVCSSYTHAWIDMPMILHGLSVSTEMLRDELVQIDYGHL